MYNITAIEDPILMIEEFIKLGLISDKSIGIEYIKARENNEPVYNYINLLFKRAAELGDLGYSVFPGYLFKHIRYNFLICGDIVDTLVENIYRYNLDILTEPIFSENFRNDKRLMINVGLEEILKYPSLAWINQYLYHMYDSYDTGKELSGCDYRYNAETQEASVSIFDNIYRESLSAKKDSFVKTYTLKIDEPINLLLKLTSLFNRTSVYTDKDNNFHMLLTTTPYEVEEAGRKLRIKQNFCDDVSLKDEINCIQTFMVD